MKTAVVLFNLGGPDSPKAVKPFLFNLFNDKFIITLPQPLRLMLAGFISWKRAPIARLIYEKIGGKSPILENTRAQAEALERELAIKGDYKVFVAMRHWHPFTKEVVADVVKYEPEKVILLPLYPQYSTTTTASAFSAWYEEAYRQKLNASHHPVCCYPFDNHYIDALVERIEKSYDAAAKHGTPRILYSAHGLPQKIVDKGDPYQWQVERTVSAVTRKLGAKDYTICYQSRVGRLQWLTPSTDDEIRRAGKDGIPIVLVPITFVSEHSETLVELDIEYRELAHSCNVPHYERTQTVGTHPEFIRTLSWLCEATVFYPSCTNSLGRICPNESKKCGFKEWHPTAQAPGIGMNMVEEL